MAAEQQESDSPSQDGTSSTRDYSGKRQRRIVARFWQRWPVRPSVALLGQRRRQRHNGFLLGRTVRRAGSPAVDVPAPLARQTVFDGSLGSFGNPRCLGCLGIASLPGSVAAGGFGTRRGLRVVPAGVVGVDGVGGPGGVVGGAGLIGFGNAGDTGLPTSLPALSGLVAVGFSAIAAIRRVIRAVAAVGGNGPGGHIDRIAAVTTAGRLDWIEARQHDNRALYPGDVQRAVGN